MRRSLTLFVVSQVLLTQLTSATTADAKTTAAFSHGERTQNGSRVTSQLSGSGSGTRGVRRSTPTRSGSRAKRSLGQPVAPSGPTKTAFQATTGGASQKCVQLGPDSTELRCGDVPMEHRVDDGGTGSADVPVVTLEDVQSWAVTASATLKLPAPAPVIGPDPMRNEWKMLAVGLPVWVWLPGADTATQSTTTNGIAIRFRAIRGATSVSWGDGAASACTTMTARPAGAAAMTPSPDCGHTYQRKGTYSVSATSVWTVFWEALGFSGVLYVPRSASTTLPVGALHSVITSRR